MAARKDVAEAILERAERLEALERELAAAGWEPVERNGSEWCSRRFRKSSALSQRMSAYAVAPDEDLIERRRI